MIENIQGFAWSNAASFVTTTLGFLFLWAAKHLLDRTVLPLFYDWWARRSKKRSLNRANRLADKHFYNKFYVCDPRLASINMASLIISRITRCSFFIVYFTCSFFVYQESAGISAIYAFSIHMVVAYACFEFIWHIDQRAIRHAVEMVYNEESQRKQIAGRLRRLLAAAGLSESQIDNWIAERLPVPVAAKRGPPDIQTGASFDRPTTQQAADSRLQQGVTLPPAPPRWPDSGFLP